MKKYVFVDINNTLFDSENRRVDDVYFLGLIHKDKARYPVIRLLKMLQKLEYTLVFFNYCNMKFTSSIHKAIQKVGFPENSYVLYTDIANDRINNARFLKQYVCEHIINITENDILFALDNDKESIKYYKSHGITVLEVT